MENVPETKEPKKKGGKMTDENEITTTNTEPRDEIVEPREELETTRDEILKAKVETKHDEFVNLQILPDEIKIFPDEIKIFAE